MNTARGARQPVIADVAKLAGVSVPTVSRVLTGAARVSAEKQRRVEEAIQTLGFRPNAAARTLASRQTRLVAVLAANTSRYGNATTLEGIEEGARAAGYTVTITVVESAEPEVVQRTVGLVLGQAIAGVIVLNFDAAGAAALHSLPAGVPAVSIAGSGEAGVSRVDLEEEAAGFALTTELLDLGHETVHHIKVPSGMPEDGRTIGWRRALVERAASVPQVRLAGWDPESGRRLALEMADDPTVTAIFCGNDEVAMGVLAGLRTAGRRVPEDVSVVGFDDHPLAAYSTPPLTTVRQDFAGLGLRAFHLFRQLIEQHVVPPDHLTAATPVIHRESTAAPPTSARR